MMERSSPASKKQPTQNPQKNLISLHLCLLGWWFSRSGSSAGAVVAPGALTSFAVAASVAGQAQAGETGAVLRAGPSVQAGVGDAATCKAHAAVLTTGSSGTERTAVAPGVVKASSPPRTPYSKISPRRPTKSGAGEGFGDTVTWPEPSRLPALPSRLVGSSRLGRPGRELAGFGALASPQGTGTGAGRSRPPHQWVRCRASPWPAPAARGRLLLSPWRECVSGWDAPRVKPSACPSRARPQLRRRGEPRACPHVVTFSPAGG